MGANEGLPSSFRDPSGFVFDENGTIYRQVNLGYREHYDRLIQSGLYSELVGRRLLVRHEEVDASHLPARDVYKVVKPERVAFISYPYEWGFSQLKDAALVTLRLEITALQHGMSLKDASAYNIQFLGGSPVLIDTLSFEVHTEGQTWVAYRQYCQHFLVPLALMSRVDVRLGQLLRVYIDGIPLGLASRLLPLSTWMNWGLFFHVHLHAKAEKGLVHGLAKSPRKVSQVGRLGLLHSLESTVRGLRWSARCTGWSGYYAQPSYDSASFQHKEQLVASYLASIQPPPAIVWDLGANTGRFAALASRAGATAIAIDADPICVEKAYLERTKLGDSGFLPLIIDLTNPSPDAGWANAERLSLVHRGPADLVLALALVHHLAIGNNVPLRRIADFIAALCHWLVIEFVPRSDPHVQAMLANRRDIFGDYHREGFESAFARHFTIRNRVDIVGSDRTLYLMARQ
jgi:ribosomal protein L11 methylase PrmA